MASPEDAGLAKLLCYRSDGEVFEQQWGDVRGIFEVQRDRLDLAHLRRCAARLGLSDLLSPVLTGCGRAGR